MHDRKMECERSDAARNQENDESMKAVADLCRGLQCLSLSETDSPGDESLQAVAVECSGLLELDIDTSCLVSETTLGY